MFIGDRLKEIRKSQKITLVQLADKSGVQLATLSRIENKKMVGSLDSHMKIAKALGIDITQLYGDVFKENQAPRTSAPTGEVFVHSDKSSYEILANKLLAKKMMPILLKIDAGGRTNVEENILGSEKFIFVIEGKIDVIAADQRYAMNKGTSLYFDASVKHWFENNGPKTAKAIVILTPVSL